MKKTNCELKGSWARAWLRGRRRRPFEPDPGNTGGGRETNKKYLLGFPSVILGRVTESEPNVNLEGKKSSTSSKRIALAALLAGIAVVLSPFYLPIGDTKCFPAQHMVNAISGVLLGPWYAVLIALITGSIRNMLGLGTIYAYPGGVFGGLIVGVIYRYIKKTDVAAILEPLGTVLIGGTVSALVVTPYLGRTTTLSFFWIAFAVSSIPGSILGLVILKAIRRVGLAKHFI